MLKNNAKILMLTIKEGLNEGLQTISKKSLRVTSDNNGLIVASFIMCTDTDDKDTKHTHKCIVYIVVDLAFYATVLGRELSLLHHCYLCQLSVT